jgi:hypothetical protein
MGLANGYLTDRGCGVSYFSCCCCCFWPSIQVPPTTASADGTFLLYYPRRPHLLHPLVLHAKKEKRGKEEIGVSSWGNSFV